MKITMEIGRVRAFTRASKSQTARMHYHAVARPVGVPSRVRSEDKRLKFLRIDIAVEVQSTGKPIVEGERFEIEIDNETKGVN